MTATQPDMTRIGGMTLRVFAAICRIYGNDERVTFIKIIEELGLSSKNGLYAPLKNLESLGWIRRDPNKMGAIVPLRRFTIYLPQKKEAVEHQ